MTGENKKIKKIPIFIEGKGINLGSYGPASSAVLCKLCCAILAAQKGC